MDFPLEKKKKKFKSQDWALTLIKVIAQWAKEWKREHTQISIVRKSLTTLYWYIDDIKLLCYNKPNVRFIHLD